MFPSFTFHSIQNPQGIGFKQSMLKKINSNNNKKNHAYFGKTVY